MDKRVIFAVAGSGKTTYIINKLDLINKSIIVTYTNNNVENIRHGIIKKWGYVPENIKILSYFSFLHSFCYKPILSSTYKTKGIYYKPNGNKFAKNDARYISPSERLYSNRISKFFEVKEVIKDIQQRLEKYYVSLFIDEVQDFAGNDFNFLKKLARANLNVLMVGDFYQHTFDTSRDGIVNKSLHNDFSEYQKQFSNMGLALDYTSLSKSYRCSPTICDFISQNIGIEIESHRNDEVLIKIINKKEEAAAVYYDNLIIKLFYQKHTSFKCNSRNWGECKGDDRYTNVCVVLNKTTLKAFDKGALQLLPSQTKNKLYVASTRAKGNLYFVSEELIKSILK